MPRTHLQDRFDELKLYAGSCDATIKLLRFENERLQAEVKGIKGDLEAILGCQSHSEPVRRMLTGLLEGVRFAAGTKLLDGKPVLEEKS